VRKWENREALYLLFTDFKKFNDSVRREVLYKIFIESGIPETGTANKNVLE